jgi:hypothetical protein
MDSACDTACAVGCPIRISTDQRLLAAPRGFSQRATSFIASWCQGIHRMPFSYSISRLGSSDTLIRPKPHHAQKPSSGDSFQSSAFSRRKDGFSEAASSSRDRSGTLFAHYRIRSNPRADGCVCNQLLADLIGSFTAALNTRCRLLGRCSLRTALPVRQFNRTNDQLPAPGGLPSDTSDN